MADGHLLINGSFLNQPTTGSGQYLRNLLPRLAAQWDGPITVVMPGTDLTPRPPSLASHLPTPPQGRGGMHAGDIAPPLPWGEGGSGRVREGGRGLRFALAVPPFRGNLGKLWFEQISIPLAARRLHADVLFVPYFGPPLVQPVPTVVTVHDVIMLAVPDFAGSRLARLYTQLAAAAARRAALVLADSEHSRRDAVRLAGIAPDRIVVAPLAAGLPAWQGSRGELRAILNAKFRLEPGYIFYCGGLDRRKDVSTLLQAFALLDGPPPLVIAGQPRSDSTVRFPNLNAESAGLGIAERVRFLGWVEEEDKALLYAGAGVFAFPSRYEGFGLTPLEAMAGGAPVVCSDATSLPEVVGDGGLLFPAGDHQALADALSRVLDDPPLAERLRAAGRQRAAAFSWDATATITAGALRGAGALRLARPAVQP